MAGCPEALEHPNIRDYPIDAEEEPAVIRQTAAMTAGMAALWLEFKRLDSRAGLPRCASSPMPEIPRKIAVTSAWHRCFTFVPAIPLSCFSTTAALPFVVNGLRLVTKAFSAEPGADSLRPVRSYQLCGVAGSLWGRPHFFARQVETAACHDGNDLLRCTVRSHR